MALLFNHRSAARFCLAGLILLCALGLAACASGSGSGGSRELPTQWEHNAFKTMILVQPEFTEEELLKFREDLAPTVDMPKEEAMVYLETEKGWPRNRATYMILKMGLASESILAGKSYAAMFPIIPAELYPSAAETALVRKHQKEVIPLFLPQSGPAAAGKAPGRSP